MNQAADLRLRIVTAINKTRTESGRTAVQPDDGSSLGEDIGLDSLDLAVLVVTLEKELGIDPFRDGSRSARTLGEFVTIYREALSA